MKNLKLLLATTAMLSMGAMAANATMESYTDAGITLPVKAEFIRTISYEVKNILDFGTVAGSVTDERVITINAEDGAITPSEGLVTLREGTRGKIRVQGSAQQFDSNISLSLPDNEHPLVLRSGTGDSAFDCAEVSNFTQHAEGVSTQYDTGYYYYVGGTVTFTDKSHLGPHKVNTCTADLTITLVHNSQ